MLENCGHEQEPAVLAKAQFYLRQLEHRWDSWVSTRDLILEIIVILLIGGEICISVWQERQQTKNFNDQQQVLENMLTNSQTTATTLGTLQSTTQTMSESLQKQLSLFYDISAVVTYEQGTKRLSVANNGRTNIVLYAFGSESIGIPAVPEKEGRTIAPGSFCSFAMPWVEPLIFEKIPKGVNSLMPFELYLKNEKAEEFVLHCKFGMTWDNDAFKVVAQLVSISPEHWSRKLASKKLPNSMPRKSS